MVASNGDELRPPRAGFTDAAHALMKGAISAVPVIGGPAAELFGLLIITPLEARRITWMNTIAERLKSLEKTIEGFSFQGLQDNPLFVTAVMHATTIALRNHQKEKLEALQNAVVNTAVGIDIEENLQLFFLEMVDELTPLQLRILTYFNDPKKWFKMQGQELSTVQAHSSPSGKPVPYYALYEAIPEFNDLDGRSVTDFIVDDLHNKGLLVPKVEDLEKETATRMFDSRTTKLGKQFIRYLSAAKPAKHNDHRYESGVPEL